MNIVIGLMVMTATVVLGMNEGDEGVCQMEETFVMSTTTSVPSSYSRSSTSCSIIIFFPICSTSYRTAYRSTTRTTYTLALRNITMCCERYVEINGTCEREETTTVPTTPLSTTTVPTTTPLSTTTTVSKTKTTPSIIMVEKPSTPLTRTEIILISGAVAITAFVVVLILIILVAICKKKRALPRSSPNPPHGSNDEAPSGRAQIGANINQGAETMGIEENLYYSKPREYNRNIY